MSPAGRSRGGSRERGYWDGLGDDFSEVLDVTASDAGGVLRRALTRHGRGVRVAPGQV